tara:strand:- start:841 stop:1095 length:255 start_codon:yes stop_codon:yes gene_type:complete
MKKIITLILYLPIVVYAQDVKCFSTYDLIINHVLTNTAEFIKKKKENEINFRFYINTDKTNIDWNKEKFAKWQILEIKKKSNDK